MASVKQRPIKSFSSLQDSERTDRLPGLSLLTVITGQTLEQADIPSPVEQKIIYNSRCGMASLLRVEERRCQTRALQKGYKRTYESVEQ